MIAACDHKPDTNSDVRRRRTELAVITAILLLGLYLRLMLLAGTTIDTPFRADARQYTAYAYNLRYHGVYSNSFKTIENPKVTPSPDAFRSPGYPLFLYLFTSSKTAERFAINVFYSQAFISTLTIALAYVLGRLVMGVSAGAIAALLTAISPHLINANFFLLTETMFTFFLVSGVATLVGSIHTKRMSGTIASGILLAIAALIKPTLQYFIFFLIGFVFFQPGFNRKTATSLMITIPFVGIFSAWLIRNMITLGYLSDPSLTIYTLQHGMYPHFMYNGDPRTFGYPYRFDPNTKQIASSMRSVVAAIVQRFLTQPTDHLIWFLSKPLYLFKWNMIQSSGTFFYPVQQSPYQTSLLFVMIYKTMRMIHPLVIFLSWIGAILAWLPKQLLGGGQAAAVSMRLLSMTYIYFILVHVVGAPFPRYSIPLRPITYVLAAVPIYFVLSVLRHKRHSK